MFLQMMMLPCLVSRQDLFPESYEDIDPAMLHLFDEYVLSRIPVQGCGNEYIARQESIGNTAA